MRKENLPERKTISSFKEKSILIERFYVSKSVLVVVLELPKDPVDR